MCGIAGVFGRSADVETVTKMTRALAHRGPDDNGVWIDPEATVGLGHRRLSIVDLSPAGHQPMHSGSSRYVITLNGEIYNFGELRSDLAAEGHEIKWRGYSDTEVLLACFDAWGIKPTLQRATGMFAFAMWDRSERALTLARDRLGEKPLYYGRQGGLESPFLFASELKALLQHPAFNPEIDREALSLFMRYLNVPAPWSIYRGISKLLPGTILTLRADATEPEIEEYWSGAEVARAGVSNPVASPAEEAVDALESILGLAIGRQMVADVPLGAFLSGGIDSSTVVAIMQKLSSRPVRTFTVGFREQAYNEAHHARAVARHLGTDHTELFVTPEQAMDVIPRLPAMFDEPFADSSQIPTHLISALARKHVTVALSGDGGDELFGGYDRYLLASGLWNRIAGIPMPIRAGMARALTAVPAGAWTTLGDAAGGLLPRMMRMRRLGEKVHKGAPMLKRQSLDELYDDMLSVWSDPSALVVGAPAKNISTIEAALFSGLGAVERMMAHDMLGYLANDILVKVDRAAMAVSLETRVPFLDLQVVEFAWRVPLEMKIRGGTTKWLLRQVLYRHVPPALIERPKMGFGVPLASWLRGALRDWAENLLDPKLIRSQGWLNADLIEVCWRQHLSGKRDLTAHLWAVLMFQSWLVTQSSSNSAEANSTAAFAD